jgi:hypothetical protein
MFEDSSWIDAVYSRSDADFRRISDAEVEVFNAESTRTGGAVGDGIVENYDLEPVRSVYDYQLEALLQVPNVNNVVEQELTSVKKDFT